MCLEDANHVLNDSMVWMVKKQKCALKLQIMCVMCSTCGNNHCKLYCASWKFFIEHMLKKSWTNKKNGLTKLYFKLGLNLSIELFWKKLKLQKKRWNFDYIGFINFFGFGVGLICLYLGTAKLSCCDWLLNTGINQITKNKKKKKYISLHR